MSDQEKAVEVEDNIHGKRVVTFNLIFEAFLSFSHIKNPSTSCTAFLMLLLEVFKACSMTNRSASLFFTLFSWPTSTVSPDHVCVCVCVYLCLCLVVMLRFIWHIFVMLRCYVISSYFNSF
jgi:hypothetical protein